MGVRPGQVGQAEDLALTLAAQNGDVTALGVLLERHRGGMRAVALSLLGPGPDVDDVMQDAALVALRRIGDLRDPQAVGPWLRMVVRNGCRTLLRASRRCDPVEQVPLPPDTATPERILEGHALRGWIWEAVEELSPALRLPVVLRYFSTGVTSYQQIAEVCAIPVGTVRSRLSQARTALATALARTAAGAYEDVERRVRAGWQEAHHTLASAERGEFHRVVRERYAPGFTLLSAGERLGGIPVVLAGMETDLCAGVRQRPQNIVAGRSLMVWEMELVNPADDPDHCPPGVAWIMTLEHGRVQRLSLHHAPRPRAAPEGAVSAS
ncbi:sigma-70 family RNA polymerase sigma factor [Kitasatospora kazusensis]|uniref:Sigma-70 family RNA polymerase sigma factor n=1 Tax=Kitasatospora kazusensis TaxID=407974 RepID=A0ABN3A6Q1_9ACTN